ncbi:MAG TPA: ferredoxin, partial [Lentisphaeria bacterium]|nr:ferredoxin [Lentisphaeria bacterium]
MFEITVNNRVIDAEEGETILSALTRVGIRVPTLCHLPDLPPMGACRICIVEVEGAEGDGLVPSCSYPVAEGMRIFTNSRKVINARRTLLELLLSNHPDDCLYCQKSRDCRLRKLAEEYGVRERAPGKRFREKLRDLTGASVVRDASKCILCGKCVRVCEEIQKVCAIGFVGRAGRTVVAPVFHQSMNVSSCVGCGQCTLVCPTGALVEHSSLDSVTAAVGDPEKCVVIQHSPAVVLAVAEEFGLKPGMDVPGLLNAALRRIGFRKVFNSAFATDIAIQERSKELVERLKSGTNLPLIVACSSAVPFIEEFYPDFIPNLSTVRSAQSILASLIRTRFAEAEGIPPDRIFSVASAPCTARKSEAAHAVPGGEAALDAVLTSRELLRLIRLYGIDFNSLIPEPADIPFAVRSTAGKLADVSGGTAEAILRTTHRLLSGRELKSMKIESVRGLDPLKETTIRVGDAEIGVVVVSGLGTA